MIFNTPTVPVPAIEHMAPGVFVVQPRRTAFPDSTAFGVAVNAVIAIASAFAMWMFVIKNAVATIQRKQKAMLIT